MTLRAFWKKWGVNEAPEEQPVKMVDVPAGRMMYHRWPERPAAVPDDLAYPRAVQRAHDTADQAQAMLQRIALEVEECQRLVEKLVDETGRMR